MWQTVGRITKEILGDKGLTPSGGPCEIRRPDAYVVN